MASSSRDAGKETWVVGETAVQRLERKMKARCEATTTTTTTTMKGSETEACTTGISLRWMLRTCGVGRFRMVDFLRTVRQMTAERRESVAELLGRVQPQLVKEVADVYVSYPGECLNFEMGETLKTLLPREGDVFVWMDVFVINQHTMEHSTENWMASVRNLIANFGKIVVILMPWDNPQNLTRSWCLWELYCATFSENINVEIMIASTQRAAFREALQDDPRELYARLANIFVKSAEAFSKSDQEMILNAAQAAEGGIETVQGDVAGLIRKWMTKEAIMLIDEAKGNDIGELAYMYSCVGILLHDQGLFDIEERYSKKALKLFKQSHGDEDEQVAICLFNLAILYQEQGKYDQAESAYREALRIWKIALGPEHLGVADCLNNIANLLHSQGKFEEAELLYYESLAIKKKEFGDNHLNVASSLDDLANLLGDQGKYEEAEALLRQSLEMRVKSQGRNHVDVAWNLNNLAFLLKDEGKYDEAQPMLLEALNIMKKCLGDDHPNVAELYDSLACLYQDIGKFNEAETNMRKALAIDLKVFGEKNFKTGIRLSILASILKDMEKFDEADSICHRALGITEIALVGDHPRKAYCFRVRAEIDLAKGRLDESEINCRKSIEMLKAVHQATPYHADIAESLLVLVKVLSAKKDGTSEEAGKECLKMFERTLGSRHPKTIKARATIEELHQ